MLNLPEFFKSDYSMILDLMRPDYIWIFSTGGLLPFCIITLTIIFLIIFAISKIFFVKKPFTIKNYFIILIISLIIYYILWVILLNIFAITLGKTSQYI